jgi:hypothetical protein
VTGRSSLRLLGCALAAAVALSGCSAKHQANESLPSTSSASPSTPALPPAGPKEFPVPTAAREKTPAGALAFAKYYIELGNKIGEGSIPPSSLLDLSRKCYLCRRIADSYEQDRAAGYVSQDATYSFKEYGPARLSGDHAELGFVYSQGAFTMVDSHGNPVPSRAGKATGDLQSGMLLDWHDELHSWIVTGLTIG